MKSKMEQTSGRLSAWAPLELPRCTLCRSIAAWQHQSGEYRCSRCHRDPGPTLAEATRSYLAAQVKRGARPAFIARAAWLILGVVGAAEDPTKSRVSGWLDRPLRAITADECNVRHAALSAVPGPQFANSVMRVLKAVWAHAAQDDSKGWPPNFTQSVSWNTILSPKQERRRREKQP